MDHASRGSAHDSLDRASALLHQVLEASPETQLAVLDALCARHPECAALLRHVYSTLTKLELLLVGRPSSTQAQAAAAVPADGGLPRTLGPFRLLELLGAGSMGAVYRAEDTELGRLVALKLIRSEMLASERTRTRFQREAAALARLDHPGLCTVYRAGSTDGQPWIAMRLVTGTTLATQLDAKRKRGGGQSGSDAAVRTSTQTRKEVRHVLQVFERIARSLAKAHAVGVVHRDLKPANIVLTEAEPVVIDFGLVHFLDSEAQLTLSGDQVGTPAYMAPEQIEAGLHEPAATTDVYSLGVTLFEALTLESPYLAKTREELFQCIVRGKHRRLRQVRRDLPAELELVLEKALELEPARRYASMSEFAEDLRRFCAHEPLLAAPPSVWYRLRKLVRRYPGPVLGGSAVFVTAVVGAMVALQFALGEKVKVREFDLLSGVVLNDRATANEKTLYPPWPHKVAAMERWLKEDAGALLAMRPGIEQTVRDLEARALPPTAEEMEADRRSHPEFASFELLGRCVASLRYAQAIREGKSQLVLPELTAAQRALDAKALNRLAWPRVAPLTTTGKGEIRTIHGEEVFGLACARAAAAKARATDGEYRVLDTLAWALLANGQDAEARAKSAEALGNAPDIEHEAYLAHQRDLDAAVTNAAEMLAAAEQQLADLGKAVNARRTFRFELEAHGFLHDTLTELLGKLSSLEAKQKAEVEKRLLWARQIQGLSLAHPNAKHAWAVVRAAIASNAKYAGQNIELRDEDITGLVPVGENPVTKLWEFYELRSAWHGKADPRTIAIPAHEPDGSIKVTGDTGIVFVLLPGGKFTMGAQRETKEGPNFDPQAEDDETPLEVTLLPFFLARHEMTQGQWARLWCGNESLRWPSFYKVGGLYRGIPVTIGQSHPVENVDWGMCEWLLRRCGMSLPTEAQWEFGCRAGKATPWYTGELPISLAGDGNVVDRDAVKHYPDWGVAEAFEDGFAGPAPVGHYRGSNAFGLYDVHGNVWEWCRDWYGGYNVAVQAGDGLRLAAHSSGRRVSRGGSHQCQAASARSASRSGHPPSVRIAGLGLRPARALRPLD